MTRRAAGCAALWLSLCAQAAVAQSKRVEFVLQRTAAVPELSRALQQAVSPLASTIALEADPPCPPASAPSVLRIVLRRDEGGYYRLCFAGGAVRALGPFSTLDAAAREQISTIVEATVEALRAPDVDIGATSRRSRPTFLLSAGYSPSLLDNLHYAHGVSADFGLALTSLPLITSLHLGHTFATTITRTAAAASARALQARAAVGGVIPLSSSVALLTQLGLTLERLTIQASAQTAENVRNPHPRTHVDPWLTAQLGPRWALTHGFWLSALLGVDVAFTQREFGFVHGDTFSSVFHSGPARGHIQLHAGIFL